MGPARTQTFFTWSFKVHKRLQTLKQCMFVKTVLGVKNVCVWLGGTGLTFIAGVMHDSRP